MTMQPDVSVGTPGVVVVSGHMVDAPDRSQPRFPPDQVPRVASEVRAALEEWKVGPDTTLVTGGARGADILAAEAAQACGARLRLVLARPPEEFIEDSVALPGTDWADRFSALLGQADVEIMDGPDDDIYARTNDRILAIAREFEHHPYAIVVWNGETGDGPGGTGDFVTQLGDDSPGERLVIIDPTP